MVEGIVLELDVRTVKIRWMEIYLSITLYSTFNSPPRARKAARPALSGIMLAARGL
jgi:hypothetical protein